MTSNVVNKKNVGFVNQDSDILNDVFSKEFLGRFSDIVFYKTLDNKLLENYVLQNLKNKKITVDALLKEANCDKYGLRNLKNLINKYNSELDIELFLKNVI